MRTLIRQFSSVEGGCLFAAAEADKAVHIFHPGVAECVRTLFTNLDFGGNRLQVVPEKNILITGAYYQYGIEGYDLTTGRRLWQRRDLRKVQNIRHDPSSATISCFFEGRAGVVLDAQSGDTLSNYRGVKDVFFSRDGASKLVVHGSKYRLHIGQSAQFEFKTDPALGLLDVAFTKNTLALSEGGEPAVILYALDSGDVLGMYEPPPGAHVLQLVHEPVGDVFAALLWNVKNASACLIHLSQKGEEVFRTPLVDGYGSIFLQERGSLLLPSGKELNIRTGDEMFCYAFPIKRPVA